jgi:MFS family permease
LTTLETVELKTNKRFYGWVAVTGAAFSALIGGGIFFYAYGVFLPMMVNEFGWSRAVVGLGMSLGALSFGLPSPLAGLLTARFGARVNLVAGNLLGALGMAGMFLAHEVWQVYLFYCIAGFGCSIGGLIPATTIANSWFIKKRSLAIGIIIACGGLGGFIFPLLATALSGSIGWRMAWVVLGGILFIGASLIGGLIMARNKPEDVGQVPDGLPSRLFKEAEIARPVPGTKRMDDETGVKPPYNLADSRFWRGCWIRPRSHDRPSGGLFKGYGYQSHDSGYNSECNCGL